MTETIPNAQPEALRLADLMDAMDHEDTRAAAAELRRNWNALTMAVASAVSSNAELAALAAAEARNATLTDDAARWKALAESGLQLMEMRDQRDERAKRLGIDCAAASISTTESTDHGR